MCFTDAVLAHRAVCLRFLMVANIWGPNLPQSASGGDSNDGNNMFKTRVEKVFLA